VHSHTDAPGGRKLEEGGWIGTLSPGPNPRPEEYPLDTCSWGVYVRFHGSEGQVGLGVSEVRAALCLQGCSLAGLVGWWAGAGLGAAGNCMPLRSSLPFIAQRNPRLEMPAPASDTATHACTAVQYCGAYGAQEIAAWADRARAWTATGRRVYFAFNNDQVPAGAALPSAISDCRDLAGALRANGVWGPASA